MRTYTCPRADLGCDAEFDSSGALDHHLCWSHGYRRSSRLVASFRPAVLPPVGGRQAREEIDRARAAGFTPGAATGAVRGRDARLPVGAGGRRLRGR